MTDPKHAKTTKAGRTYTIPGPDGTDTLEVPSVTTILGILSKPLHYWSANEVARFAIKNNDRICNLLAVNETDAAYDLLRKSPWESRDTKASKGTAVHDVIERFLLGEEIPTDDQTPYFRAARDFLTDNSLEIEMAEATVYNLTHGYAGTLDAMTVFKDWRDVVDWKTRQGKRVKGTRVYDSELLQIAAYAHAEGILLPDGTTLPMPDISGGAVVMLCEDGFKVGRADLDRDFKGFLAAKELYDWRKTI